VLMGKMLSLDCQGRWSWSSTAVYYILHASLLQGTKSGKTSRIYDDGWSEGLYGSPVVG